MFYTQHIESCLSENGVTHAGLQQVAGRLTASLSALKQGENKAANPLLSIAPREDDLAEIEKIAGDIRARFSHVVVVGAGGSGLSGRVLTSLKPVGNPAICFLETIDPDAIDDMLARVDLKNCFFIVISKSGGTVETLGHFYVLLDKVKKSVGNRAGDHFLVITMENYSALRQAATEGNAHILEHEPDIGGRFSIFTNVGLLPAAIAGLDIAAIRKGAASVVTAMKDADAPADCAPALGAALQYAFMERGRNISVMLPYAERLAGFSSWYRQSWAESLGKSGKGSTPIRAVGTTDQHSQLQLYLDGPKDKLFHMITVARAGTGHSFATSNRADLSYLKGKTTGDIMAAEQKATLETLVRNGCPVRVFELKQLKEEQIGALLMHFTLEIIFMSALLSVNPFDQPAVEESKELAREYLRTGNV